MNSSLEKQSKIQEQLTDGKAIHRPSDDPIKTIRSLRFNSNLAMNEQFTQNLSDSQSWMDNTDGAMSDLSSIMIRAKELAVSADGTKTPDELTAIGAEMDQLINQSITIGNTKIGDRYLFAGQMDNTQPFERRTISDPTNPNATPMDVVVYNGDLNKISMQIKSGVVNPAQDGININGSDLFGPIKSIYGQPTTEIFNQLIAIKQELQGTRHGVTNPTIAGTITKGGTSTAYTYYDVRIDGVDNGALSLGQVNAASYSVDGGKTWTAAGTTPGNPSTLALANGETLSIGKNPSNKAGATYSFQAAPPTDTAIAGAVTVGGKYTGTSYSYFNVRIDTATAAGQVDTASYSIDGGTKWTSAGIVPGDPSKLTLTSGMTLEIKKDVGNLVGQTYSFREIPATDKNWISQVGIANIDAAHSAQLKQQTQLGAKMATYEMAKNMMEAQNATITDDLSANEDLDFSTAIINQKTSENVYKAALAVGAKIMPVSLVDFLR